jgi:uncharacterized protein (DUF2267 family)
MMQKTNKKLSILLHKIAKETGKPSDLVAAKAVLKSILHGLRDSLSIDTSIKFLTALPPYLKEVFIENWQPSKNSLRDAPFEEALLRIHYHYSINSFPPAKLEIIQLHYNKVRTLLEASILPLDGEIIKRILPEIAKNQKEANLVAA